STDKNEPNMHLTRDNQLVSILDNLNEPSAAKACNRRVRLENGGAPGYISQNGLRSDGFKGIEPIAEKGIVYERTNANNTFSTSNLPSTQTPKPDPWTDYNKYENDSTIPTLWVGLGVPLVLMVNILIAITLVALHKRYKRGKSCAPQQSTSKPQVPEMEASCTIPQELAAGSWAEYGVSAREGTKELEGPNCQRVEMKARESVAQEMKARESVAKELDIEAIHGDIDLEKGLSDQW
ncbi:MAG: hypothetical protein Q9214_002703, partial [Letrouitia sp. 1 TL-2023]